MSLPLGVSVVVARGLTENMDGVGTAIILGAGYSKAAAGLPFADDLGNQLRRRVPRLGQRPCAPSNGARSSRGCPVSRSPQPDLDDVANRTMNTRPGKILGWKTSTVVFQLAT